MEKSIKSHLEKIFKHININPEVEIKEGEKDSFAVEINGNNLNFLIGYRGETLEALQNIIRQAIFKEKETWPKLHIDINGYQKSKLEKLEDTVKGFIDRVRFHQKEIKLPPLTSYERRHIHTFVGDYMDVESESKGEGLNRRLFLKPKD
ncbi:protein jag [Patescibacteria group bacterium]